MGSKTKFKKALGIGAFFGLMFAMLLMGAAYEAGLNLQTVLTAFTEDAVLCTVAGAVFIVTT